MATKRKANSSNTKPKRTPRKSAVLFSLSDYPKGKSMARSATARLIDDIPSVVSKTIRYDTLKKIQPKTYAQEKVFDQFKDNNMILHGYAGTGKTFIAMHLAFREILLRDSPYEKVIILRSIVPVRDIGFLPGTVEEKTAPYEEPYRAILNELFMPIHGGVVETLRDMGMYQFASTCNLRGITFRNAIIIVDEISNLTFQEADTVITRLGENCKLIFCGDKEQTDLTTASDRSGFGKFLSILDSMSAFRRVEFLADDIVRSALVKEYIINKHRLFPS